jgi:hypothetical protein
MRSTKCIAVRILRLCLEARPFFDKGVDVSVSMFGVRRRQLQLLGDARLGQADADHLGAPRAAAREAAATGQKRETVMLNQ